MADPVPPPFDLRIKDKSLENLAKPIASREKLLKKPPSPIRKTLPENGATILENQQQNLYRLANKTNLGEIRKSIAYREKQKKSLEISPLSDLQARGINREIEALKQAEAKVQHRLFLNRIQHKTGKQLEQSIADREIVLKRSSSTLLEPQKTQLQWELSQLKRLHVETRDKHHHIDRRIEEIQKTSLSLPDLQIPNLPTASDILKSKQQQTIGSYVIARNYSVRKDSPSTHYAVDQKTQRVVCIKETKKTTLKGYRDANRQPEHITDAETYVRARTNSPNIGASIETYEDKEKIYRVYEPGNKDLDTYLLDHTVSLQDALKITIGTVQALRELHGISAVHFDVTPPNILLNDQITLIDFDDISIQNPDTGKFHRGDPRGFRWAKPPELFEQNSIGDPRSDIYEAGILLFRTVTGSYPYIIPKKIPMELWTNYLQNAHLKGKFNIPDLVPDSIKKILKKSIRPRPKDRYQTATDMMVDLLKAYDEITPTERSKIINTAFILRQPDFRADSAPSPTLTKNSEAKLDTSFERSAYIKRQNPIYMKQLKELDAQIGQPMDKSTEIAACIPVAGHQEIKNIYKTIATYQKQTLSKKQFELLLFVNLPEKYSASKKADVELTIYEIQRAQKDFPDMNIQFVSAIIPDNQARIGNIRKIVTDLALLRQQEAGISKDILLLSNDADSQGIDANYLKAYLDYFAQNDEMDGAVGNLSFDPRAWIRFPALQARQEFIALLDQVGFQRGNADLFGNNSVMKSSIYAAIGGYPPNKKTGEQEWTGDTIRILRKSKKTLGFVPNAILVTSARRGLISLLSGNRIPFGDEQAEANMRALSLESFPIFQHDNLKQIPPLTEKIQKLLNFTIGRYETGEHLGKNAPYYRLNLKKIGISYRVEGDPKSSESKIVITDISKFLARNKRMQDLIAAGETNMASVVSKCKEIPISN